MDVEYIKTERTTEEKGKVKILIAEIVACRECELGQAVAYILAVSLRTLNTLDDVSILVIYEPFAIGIDTAYLNI